MSAPDLETLLDFETQIEVAFAELLQEQGFQTAISDDPDVLETPRADITAVVENQGPHEIQVPSGEIAGRRIYDQFTCSAEVSIFSDPTWTQSPNTLRGSLRKALLFITPDALNAKLDYLVVAANSFRQSGGMRSTEPSEGAIKTTVTFELQVWIRSDAWPT